MRRTNSPLLNICVCIIFILLQGTVPVRAKENQPNILFIVIDDLNDWVGHLGGHPNVKTPNIDRLAKRGISFTNAHVSATSCTPSRSAALSGLRPSTTGIYGNKHQSYDVLRNVTTLTQYFKAQGYRVLGGGKVYPRGKFHTEEYFHNFYDVKKEIIPVPKTHYNELELEGKFDWKPLDIPEQEMPDYKLVTWAVEELDEQRDLPFFLAIGLRRPHLPWYVPRKYFDMYPKNELVLPETSKNDLSDIPETGLKLIAANRDHNPIIESRRWLDAVQAYLASITFMDDQVGRLIEALDSSPNADDTIIVLWSDHGFHLGEKKHWGKSTLWEESTRVPLIIVAPGVTKPGTLSARPVDTMSIYPTLADLSGLPIPDHVQGTTLRPLLEDPNAPWKRIALTTYGRGNHAIRTDRWRYIRYRDGTEELYDHFNDPMEWRNLVQAQSTTEISKLKDQFSEWIPVNEAEDAPLKPNSKSVWLKLIHTLLR